MAGRNHVCVPHCLKLNPGKLEIFIPLKQRKQIEGSCVFGRQNAIIYDYIGSRSISNPSGCK